MSPTYGVPYGLVIGIIAGGSTAITNAVEFAEDDREQGWKDLLSHNVSDKDVVIGIAASGTTPYVIEALNHCLTLEEQADSLEEHVQMLDGQSLKKKNKTLWYPELISLL